MKFEDALSDYREAQAAGHHPDCDGWRTAHRVTIERTPQGTWRAVCAEGCELHTGSFGSDGSARAVSANHSQEVRCDLRCQAWEDHSEG